MILVKWLQDNMHSVALSSSIIVLHVRISRRWLASYYITVLDNNFGILSSVYSVFVHIGNEYVISTANYF